MERKRFDRGETIAATVAPDMGQLDANTAAAGEQSAHEVGGVEGNGDFRGRQNICNSLDPRPAGVAERWPEAGLALGGDFDAGI